MKTAKANSGTVKKTATSPSTAKGNTPTKPANKPPPSKTSTQTKTNTTQPKSTSTTKTNSPTNNKPTAASATKGKVLYHPGDDYTTVNENGVAYAFAGEICVVCNQAIGGARVIENDKSYHSECFVCTKCNKFFPGRKYYKHEGKVYCEKDYKDIVTPSCEKCKKPVPDAQMMVKGKVYHPQCFTCANCKKMITGGDYQESQENGKPYCSKCSVKTMEVPGAQIQCSDCNKPIEGECVDIDGKSFHPKCIKCTNCDREYTDSFRRCEGKYYCKYHLPSTEVVPGGCSGCGKAGTTSMVSMKGKLWHDRCLVCSECKLPFSKTKSDIIEHEGRLFCSEDYAKKFSKKCAGCNKQIELGAHSFDWMDKTYHMSHCKCVSCGRMLDSEIFELGGDPHCGTCLKVKKEQAKAKKKEAVKKK